MYRGSRAFLRIESKSWSSSKEVQRKYQYQTVITSHSVHHRQKPRYALHKNHPELHWRTHHYFSYDKHIIISIHWYDNSTFPTQLMVRFFGKKQTNNHSQNSMIHNRTQQTFRHWKVTNEDKNMQRTRCCNRVYWIHVKRFLVSSKIVNWINNYWTKNDNHVIGKVL